MAVTWEVAAETHTGLVRDRNEDNHVVVPLTAGRQVLAVCDGMGGHADGDVASRTATAHLAAALPPRADEPPYAVLYEEIQAAHRAVLARAQGSGMGTTVVTAWLDGPRFWYAWVGDSRLYLVRQGVIAERTTDHTHVARMVRSGYLTQAQADAHPDAHLLTQALGVRGAIEPETFADPVAVQPGDLLVLCSDGLHDLVEVEEIAALPDAPAVHLARELVRMALSRGGHDNVTVIVARARGPGDDVHAVATSGHGAPGGVSSGGGAPYAAAGATPPAAAYSPAPSGSTPKPPPLAPAPPSAAAAAPASLVAAPSAAANPARHTTPDDSGRFDEVFGAAEQAAPRRSGDTLDDAAQPAAAAVTLGGSPMPRPPRPGLALAGLLLAMVMIAVGFLLGQGGERAPAPAAPAPTPRTVAPPPPSAAVPPATPSGRAGADAGEAPSAARSPPAASPGGAVPDGENPP